MTTLLTRCAWFHTDNGRNPSGTNLTHDPGSVGYKYTETAITVTDDMADKECVLLVSASATGNVSNITVSGASSCTFIDKKDAGVGVMAKAIVKMPNIGEKVNVRAVHGATSVCFVVVQVLI